MDGRSVNRSVYAQLGDSLLGFACYVTPFYKPSGHHRVLADALERVERGECRRLIVTMPPQRGKSQLTSRLFPAWALGRDPDRKIMVISYSAEKAVEFSRDARDIVRSDRYRKVFPQRQLAYDSQAVGHWRFEESRGFVHAVGAGGPITGFGADLMILDDLVKDQEQADSASAREKLWQWYSSVAYTRLSPQGAVVLVMTRWHEDDICGRLLQAMADDPLAEKWEVVHLPALDDEDSPLWPERYTLEDYERIRRTVGPRTWEALYQGRPRPDDGAMFKRSWFKVIQPHEVPKLERWVRAWDVAASQKTSADYNAGVLMGLDEDGSLIVAHVAHHRGEWPETRRRIIELALADQARSSVSIGIANTGLGLPMYQDLNLEPELSGIRLDPIVEKGDKVSRARVFQARAEMGLVKLVDGPWLDGLLRELEGFPLGKHDDQVDALSGACTLLFARQGRRVDERDEMAPSGISPNSWTFIQKLVEFMKEQEEEGENWMAA